MATNGTTNGTTNERLTTNGGHISDKTAPKITLYTNHGCPFAQRAHITLDELKLDYEEIIIDLETPRPQWYLDINPRGLVPTIKYSIADTLSEEIITESAVVAQFLCDNFPSHLLPASTASPSAALVRARIAFLCQTWTDKISPAQFAVMRAESAAEKEIKAKEYIAVIEKEIEPLLANANPFFGGSKDLTFAEVFTAPFVMRWVALAEDGEMVPSGLLEKMESLPNFTKWMKAILGHGNATRIFEKEEFLDYSRKRLKKMAKV